MQARIYALMYMCRDLTSPGRMVLTLALILDKRRLWLGRIENSVFSELMECANRAYMQAIGASDSPIMRGSI